MGPRGGVTLVELLVVIALLMMITAVTIPAVTPAIQQRRQREAARLVSSYVTAARSRAMESGRPVAVVIERFVSGLASTSQNATQAAPSNYLCMSLSVAESPPPYNGDFVASTAVFTTTTPTPTAAAGTVLQLIQFATADNWQDQQIRIGDRVRVGYQGPLYTVINGGSVNANGVITGLPLTLFCSTPVMPSDAVYINTAVHQAGGSNYAGLPFQILRQPMRSSIPPLQLPEGIAIDLAYSGMSTQAAASNLSPATYGFDTTTANPMISFSPNGSVDWIYNTGSTHNSFNGHPTGPFFLLIGRQEQIAISGYTPASTDTAGHAAGPLSFANNLADPNSLWIAISNLSGQVATSENYVTSYVDPAHGGNVLTNLANARGIATGSIGQVVTTLGGN